MTSSDADIAVIGAGPMGLACAYHLVRLGHTVDVYEAGDRVGGMSASFDFNGLMIERFFHFICGSDVDYFELLDDLGIRDKLRWRRTRMGFYCNGRLNDWGDPVSLLRFPHLDFLTKFRYGLQVLATKRRKHFDDLEHQRARDWLTRWIGRKGYDVLWKPLFALKFYGLQDELSAAWIAARIQRVAQSRPSLMHEELGYLEGCTQTLLNALEEAILAGGGRIHTQAPIDEVLSENGEVLGVKTQGTVVPYRRVVSTIPLPYVPDQVPGLPESAKANLRAIRNIGVVTIKLQLREALTPYFWTNISDPSMPIPGVIEYTNLNPLSPHVVYIPCYMPQTHQKYGWSLEQFLEELIPILQRLNPDFTPDWIIAAHQSRYHFAQPVCEPGFSRLIPPMEGLLKGYFLADTTAYYPQDRCISESVRVGKQLAHLAHVSC